MISILLNKLRDLSTNQLQSLLVLSGMLIAAQMQYIQHGWINPDSVLYFESARLFTIGEWKQALKVFNWPLYSLLIAGVHNLTTLNIHSSAQLLNVIFFGITTASFMKLISLGGGDKKVMLAGALILFSANYLVGDVLEMLMRDPGFWAFFLTSLLFFIRFYKYGHLNDALLWQVTAMIATLFRIEGITYLIFLPLILFFSIEKKFAVSIRRYIQCNLINLIAVIIILTAVFAMNVISADQLGRLNEVFTVNLYDELTHKLFTQSVIMNELVLGQYLDEFAVQGLLLTFIYILIAKTISATGLVNVGLAVLTLRSKAPMLNEETASVLKFTAVLALFNMGLIITKVFVLSGRYVLALALILMIFASYYFAKMFAYLSSRSKADRKWKWLTIILIIFMSLSLIKNMLPKKTGYNYQQEAIAWLRTTNEAKKPVFYDDARARYYANEPFSSQGSNNWNIVMKAINNNSLNQYHYLVISHSSKHPEREKVLLEKLVNFREINRFKNSDAKKSVVIYEKNSD